jgi:beta-phosphoglucomutase family hydrolase
VFQKAFLFDLNGTMIDDMEYHTRAWYEILNDDLGANLNWQQVKEHMYGKNQEVLIRIFGNDRFSNEEMDSLAVEKESRYQSAFKPHLRLIKGLDRFLQNANEQGVGLAIGSAAILVNIDFVLDGLGIRHYFSAIVSADHVTVSKPDPQTFLMAAKDLGVDPSQCIVFEDAPKGVEAALNAGMQVVVITTMHEEEEFSGYPNILAFISDYDDGKLQQLGLFK